jgi:hypothetical protein
VHEAGSSTNIEVAAAARRLALLGEAAHAGAALGDWVPEGSPRVDGLGLDGDPPMGDLLEMH